MGKKNKPKNNDSTESKPTSGQRQEQQPGQGPQQSQAQQGARGEGQPQQSRNTQQSRGDRQQGVSDQQQRNQGGQQQRGHSQQQGGDGQRQRSQQQVGSDQQRGAWGQQQRGGNEQQSGSRQEASGDPQRGAWGQQRGGGEQQRGSRQQAGGDQQQGAWGQQQRGGDVQHSGSRQETSGDPQRGAWGQQQRGGGEQQRGSRQQAGGDQQQGAWGQQQRGGSEQQRGGGEQQRGSRQQAGGDQQRGAWGQQQHGGSQQQRGGDVQHSGSRQEASGDQQRGAWGQQQRGGGEQQRGSRQQAGGDQQQGAWGQQRGEGQQQRGGDVQHSGSRQQTGSDQQRGSWGQQREGQQQRGQDRQQAGGDQQRGDRGQQRGPNQSTGYQQRGNQQYGRGQQQTTEQSGSSQLTKRMGELTISNEPILPAKDKSCNGIVRGTLGKPGTVEVNYVRLNLDKMPDEAYHYDVTITPDRPKKFLRAAFEQFRLEVFPNQLLTFDGFKNCYAMERLSTPVERKVEVLDTNNRMKEFQVEIKETDTCAVDLKSLRTYQNDRIFDKPMRALQVLEVVLASNNHERGIRVGRSFFRRPDDAFDLTDGYEAWTGLYQAAILGELPLLNVDIAHKSFPRESTLTDYLDEMKINKNDDLRRSVIVCSFLKGMNITYTPPQSFGAAPKQYKVLEVGEPASRKTFKTDDGKELTVANYYKSRGYTLKYPNLNCLSVGSTVRQISLPMELCSIPSGQALNRKDQSRQVEKMIRYAATSTNRRKQKIMELLSYFDHNVNPVIRAFGLSIGSSFIKVPMRMLPSPFMEYLQGRTVTTFKGAWRMDNLKYLICSQPPNGHRWAILYEECARISYHELEAFKSSVINTSRSLNMNLQNTAEIKAYTFRQLSTTLKQLASDRYDLVFVVLSDRGTPYSKIKQIAELEVGILTQCIKDKTVFRTKKDMSVFSNILLKVNGKLNGTNHKIAKDKDSNLLSSIKKVMYLGADVTHPSPDQRHIPSVVGVAASHDANGACYNCQYRLQRSTVENIEDMESIFCHHLEVYYKYQKSYPDQIIYYRDGVSDGQFPIVEREEISAIKRACKKKGCNPKLTCVIVVKRHHTRFFPLTQPQHDRDFNNVQAGTVVDQYITHPNELQFFMVSHQSIQGTARPTRYNVIRDESNFDINLLQKLTYNLCHLFPRCNRAVSYPAPAYLAHLVAFRGRVYLEGTQKFGNLKTEYERRLIKPDFMIKNPMYFI